MACIGVLFLSADCGNWWLYKATQRSKVCSISPRLLNLWVFRTSAMRQLKRSTMPLVLGNLLLVSQCTVPNSWHSTSNSWQMLASRAQKS